MHSLLECLAYLFGRGTVKLCQSFKYVKKLAKNGTKRFNVETKFLADFYYSENMIFFVEKIGL